jgi:hypothetical protein
MKKIIACGCSFTYGGNWSTKTNKFNSFPSYADKLGHKLSTEIINIKFECDYNFPLNNLPAHIESLVLYYNYNIELTNLPCNLKCLVLGCEYNKPLYYLPESYFLNKLYIKNS